MRLPGELVGVAGEARRLGLIDLKQSGRMIDVSLPGLFTERERTLFHGTRPGIIGTGCLS